MELDIWAKTKVQLLRDLLDDTLKVSHAFGKDI